MSSAAFNEIEHIEINVVKVSNIILFHIFHVVKIKHELINIIAAEHNIKSIINEINVNYNLKSAVKTVVKSFYVEFLIDFVKVSVIHVKLLLKLKSDTMRDQSMKEFRQDDKSVLTSLRKQNDDILITDLIQLCFMHHICEKNFI